MSRSFRASIRSLLMLGKKHTLPHRWLGPQFWSQGVERIGISSAWFQLFSWVASPTTVFESNGFCFRALQMLQLCAVTYDHLWSLGVHLVISHALYDCMHSTVTRIKLCCKYLEYCHVYWDEELPPLLQNYRVLWQCGPHHTFYVALNGITDVTPPLMSSRYTYHTQNAFSREVTACIAYLLVKCWCVLQTGLD